ncbi:MAG: prepilin-type N-terminal cleavage/methylation domain-containing protein [Pyrinomonadaceae bacterium]|nr:prepilin-type N-terminal cleavage/methylation domain-containing protein [Pyrinomonadaceae bacterium]
MKNSTSRKPRTIAKSNESGFTLIELMVSLLIFLIVTASIYGLLQAGRVDRNRTSGRADILKNIRTSLNLIGRDALNSGLGYTNTGALVPDDFLNLRLGLPADTNPERDNNLTGVIAGNNLFPNNLGGAGVQTDSISFIYSDRNANDGRPMELLDAYQSPTNSNAVRLKMKSPLSTVATSTSPLQYDLLLIATKNPSNIAGIATQVATEDGVMIIDLEPGDPLGINQSLGSGDPNQVSVLRQCTAGITTGCTRPVPCIRNGVNSICTGVASVKHIFWVNYRVTPQGTLIRSTYGNNTGQPATSQIQDLPLTYNVRNMQVNYVLENGTVTDDPGTQSNNVRQVTITLIVQSDEIDVQTRQPTLITLTSTFSTRNIKYAEGLITPTAGL